MALRLNAASIVVAHNHPSTDPTPSPEDILVTQQIVEAEKLLDCETLDHLIIAANRYVSLRERGARAPLGGSGLGGTDIVEMLEAHYEQGGSKG